MIMRKCRSCDEYTFGDVCKKCGKKTIIPGPARYSPEDRYGKYRRMMKKWKM